MIAYDENSIVEIARIAFIIIDSDPDQEYGLRNEPVEEDRGRHDRDTVLVRDLQEFSRTLLSGGQRYAEVFSRGAV